MADALTAPSPVHAIAGDRPEEIPLSVGATLTLRAAERHAARTGSPVTPSHLLVALLERPDPRVRAFLAERGASLTWLCDTAFAGVSQLRELHGPGIDTIVDAARVDAGARGQARIDDLSLLQALFNHGDSLSNRLAAEAGLLTVEPTSPSAPVPVVNDINALVAAPSPFAPRLGAPTWSTMVRQSRWRRNLRALLGDISVSPIFLLMVAVVLGSGALLASGAALQYQRALTVTFIVAVYLVSLCMHEFGHAAAAYLTGERRVKDQGYLTLDIRRYTNPLLSFGLPLISLFAGYMPLPGGCVWLQPSMFHTVREERFISAAGPAANLLCLMVLSIPLHLGMDQWSPLGIAISATASLQAGVFLFNLLPVPPLDGWNIVTAGSSHHLRAQAAALGFMPLLALLMLFRASPELGATYWGFVDGFSALFAIDWWPATYGRWMLSFR